MLSTAPIGGGARPPLAHARSGGGGGGGGGGGAGEGGGGLHEELHAQYSLIAVVVLSALFFTVTLCATGILVAFCKKNNSVFSLQKSEQDSNYEMDDLDEDEEDKTDTESCCARDSHDDNDEGDVISVDRQDGANDSHHDRRGSRRGGDCSSKRQQKKRQRQQKNRNPPSSLILINTTQIQKQQQQQQNHQHQHHHNQHYRRSRTLPELSARSDSSSRAEVVSLETQHSDVSEEDNSLVEAQTPLLEEATLGSTLAGQHPRHSQHHQGSSSNNHHHHNPSPSNSSSCSSVDGCPVKSRGAEGSGRRCVTVAAVHHHRDDYARRLVTLGDDCGVTIHVEGDVDDEDCCGDPLPSDLSDSAFGHLCLRLQPDEDGEEEEEGLEKEGKTTVKAEKEADSRFHDDSDLDDDDDDDAHSDQTRALLRR